MSIEKTIRSFAEIEAEMAQLNKVTKRIYHLLDEVQHNYKEITTVSATVLNCEKEGVPHNWAEGEFYETIDGRDNSMTLEYCQRCGVLKP